MLEAKKRESRSKLSKKGWGVPYMPCLWESCHLQASVSPRSVLQGKASWSLGQPQLFPRVQASWTAVTHLTHTPQRVLASKARVEGRQHHSLCSWQGLSGLDVRARNAEAQNQLPLWPHTKGLWGGPARAGGGPPSSACTLIRFLRDLLCAGH